MPQKGNPWHDDLPQHQQSPGVQLCRHVEEAKDASLCSSSQAVVNHDEAKDDS